jgi:hypothetical protein
MEEKTWNVLRRVSIKQFPDWNLNGEKNDSRVAFVLIIESRAVIFIQYSKYKVQAPRAIMRLLDPAKRE